MYIDYTMNDTYEIPTYSKICKAMAIGGGTFQTGNVKVTVHTPYTRRCCEVRRDGVLLGTRYTPSTAWKLIVKACMPVEFLK
jgi:hypothetical protein